MHHPVSSNLPRPIAQQPFCHISKSLVLATALLTIVPSITTALPSPSASPNRISLAKATCPSPGLDLGTIESRLSQSQYELNQQNVPQALAILKSLLPQVRPPAHPSLRASLLEVLLLRNEPLGLYDTPLRNLQDGLVAELDWPGSPELARPQTLALLQELGQLALELPSGYSLTKTRSLTQLADHALSLGQTSLAQSWLQVAETTALSGVRGAPFQARALAQVARVQAIANQSPAAQRNLIRAIQLHDQLPAKSRPQPLPLELGIAAASLGDEAFTQRWLKALGNTESVDLIRQTQVRRALGQRQPQTALTIARAIPRALARTQMLGEIGQYYGRVASPKTGQIVLAQAWTAAKSDVGLQQQLVQAAVKAGYLDQAWTWANQVTSDSPSATYQALILALAKAKQTDKAGQLLERYGKQIQTTVDSNWQLQEFMGWTSTIRRARLQGWIADHWQKLSPILSASGAVAWESFAVDYARHVSIPAAATWTEKLIDRPIDSPFPGKILAVTALADYAYSQGQAAQAQTLLTRLEAQIEPYSQRLEKEGQSIEPIRSEAYARIARSYGKAGQKAQASRLIQLAIEANPNLGNSEFVQPTYTPYRLMMEAGLFDLAQEVAEANGTEEARVQELYGTAIAKAQTGQLDLAQQLLKRPALVGGMRTNLLLTIAAQQRGNTAIATLGQALTAARSIPGAESEFDRLGAEGGTIIPMETDRGSVVIAVAVAYAKLGLVEQARAIVTSLKDEENRRDGMRLIQEAQKPSC